MFQIAIDVPSEGTIVLNTGDDLSALLKRIETLVRGGHSELRRQAGEKLRNAGERFLRKCLYGIDERGETRRLS